MNNKIELYFPTEANGEVIEDTKEWNEAYFNAIRVLVNLFNGLSELSIRGHWRNSRGNIVTEKIHLMYSHCDNQQLNAFRGHVNNLARKVCIDLKQDTVALVINGEMNFVS